MLSFRQTCRIAALIAVAGCTTTEPSGGPERVVSIAEFDSLRIPLSPTGGGAYRFSATASDSVVRNFSVPLSSASATIRRRVGDPSKVDLDMTIAGDWLVNRVCTFVVQGPIDVAALDGRSITFPVTFSNNPSVALSIQQSNCRVPYGTGNAEGSIASSPNPVGSVQLKVRLEPTGATAGRLTVELAMSGTQFTGSSVTPLISDFASQYEGDVGMETEVRRDGSVFANGALVRAAGGATPTTSAPGTGSTPNLPPFPVGTVTCPTPPSGYICISRNGVATPMRRSGIGVLTGWYHSASYKACINIQDGGNVTYAYGPGYPGPARTAPFGPLGTWGVPVASTGVPTGSADGRYVYLYTDHADSQLALMLYDLETKTFQGFGFKRETCPY